MNVTDVEIVEVQVVVVITEVVCQSPGVGFIVYEYDGAAVLIAQELYTAPDNAPTTLTVAPMILHIASAPAVAARLYTTTLSND